MRSLDHCAAGEISLAGVLYALADPIRLRIARVLCDGGEHVQADFPADVSQSTLSHHMKRLRQAGVAWSRPEGTRCFVSLRPELEQRFPGLLAVILAAADGADEVPSGPAMDADGALPGPGAGREPSRA
jgi:DNA-binding transcriptional ArsR family regulator